jgi:hypothetical protein
MIRGYRVLKSIRICGIAAVLCFSCTSKKVSSSHTDDRLYPDDSEINMKTTEKSMKKMPFDTSAVPVVPKRRNK